MRRRREGRGGGGDVDVEGGGREGAAGEGATPSTVGVRHAALVHMREGASVGGGKGSGTGNQGVAFFLNFSQLARQAK